MIGFLTYDNGKPTKNTSSITDLVTSKLTILNSHHFINNNMPPNSLITLKSKDKRKQRKVIKLQRACKINHNDAIDEEDLYFALVRKPDEEGEEVDDDKDDQEENKKMTMTMAMTVMMRKRSI